MPRIPRKYVPGCVRTGWEKQCNDCGAKGEVHAPGCISRVDEGCGPAHDQDCCTHCLRTGLELMQEGHGLGCLMLKKPLPHNALTRFPTHNSDILILLDDLKALSNVQK